MTENAARDQNMVPTLLGVSSSDGFSPIKIYADPITHRLLVSISGGGAGMAIGGSITSATQGSVLFAGAAGVLAQDNNQLYFQDNATTPSTLATNTNVALSVNVSGDFTGTDAVNIYGQYDAFLLNSQITNSLTGLNSDGKVPGFTSSSARGTASAITQLQAADMTGGFFGFGAQGASSPTYQNLGGMGVFTTGASTNNLGGELRFYTKADGGSLAQVMTVNNAGFVGIGTTNPGGIIDARGYSQFSDGTQGLQIGAATFAAGYGAIYAYGVTPTNSNYYFAATNGATFLNSNTEVSLAIGANTKFDIFATFVRSDVPFTIGNITMGAMLTINAGTATAGTAPIMFTAGVNLTTPVAGIMEYDGINQYFTPSGTTRKVTANYQTARTTAQTAAVASVVAWTVGASDGSFLISSNVNVTTFSVGTFNVTCTYTDETNTSRTLTLNFSSVTGTLGIAIAAAGAFEGIPVHIRAKAATAITVATSGTFTSLTYNAEGAIAQIA